MKYWVGLVSILCFVNLGCSTRSVEINKNPLHINTPLGKPVCEFGSMEVSETNLDVGHSFSVFLWPKQSKLALDTLSAEVSLLSRTIDRLTKEYRERNQRILREQAFWRSWQCNKETDKPSAQTEPQDCEKIILDPTKNKSLACGCLLANEPLLKSQNLENLNTRMSIGQKIVALVEDDLEPGNNWLLGGGEISTRVGSVLKIRPSQQGGFEVYLRLKHFGQKDMVYKTTASDDDTKPNEGQIVNAKYDPLSRLLTFTLIEKVDGKKTGNFYVFQMERGFAPEGAPELVRFKGGFKKISRNGTELGFGAAKFDADWNEDPVCNTSVKVF